MLIIFSLMNQYNMLRNFSICLLYFIYNFIIVESIYGGYETTISNFPYQVSIHYDSKHDCGGSIVDTTTILTAAHCVHGRDYSKYSVKVGHTSHNAGQDFRVIEVIEHQDYRETTFNNDVALLKLDFPLTFSSNIQPIKLQKPGKDIPKGTLAWISGWGRTDTGIYPEKLRTTYVEIITNKKCSSKHGKDKITTYMVCAYTSRQDACTGDSGGALVVDGVQIGIVSWGRGCARQKYPGVYSKVSELYDWIQKNKNNKNYNFCPI